MCEIFCDMDTVTLHSVRINVLVKIIELEKVVERRARN